MTNATLRARGLRSREEIGALRPHGDRLRYVGGCRCDECRKANSAYENARSKARRAGDWNGIVSATKARNHMKALADQGVGRRAVAEATNLAESLVQIIRNGKRRHIRARTERKILAVTHDQALDSALIPAAPTLALIAELIEEGYTRGSLAKRLGYKHRTLQFYADTITVKNAARISRLHRELTT